jgi:hypothetical protein
MASSGSGRRGRPRLRPGTGRRRSAAKSPLERGTRPRSSRRSCRTIYSASFGWPCSGSFRSSAGSGRSSARLRRPARWRSSGARGSRPSCSFVRGPSSPGYRNVSGFRSKSRRSRSKWRPSTTVLCPAEQRSVVPCRSFPRVVLILRLQPSTWQVISAGPSSFQLKACRNCRPRTGRVHPTGGGLPLHVSAVSTLACPRRCRSSRATAWTNDSNR